jgi:hypothetical protein
LGRVSSRLVAAATLVVVGLMVGPQAVLGSDPQAPTNVLASLSTTAYNYVDVSWDAPSSTPIGMGVTGYLATASPGGKTCGTGRATTETCTVKGLTLGTAYTFTVQALFRNPLTGAQNYGPASDPSTPITPARPPDTPLNVTGVPGDGQVEVTWNKSRNDGGSPITAYVATASPDGQFCTSTDPEISRCTVTGLTNGTPYTFTVIATNAIGSSLPSDPSPKITPTNTLYVDGLNGSDQNNGACMSAPDLRPQKRGHRGSRSTAEPTCGPLKTIYKASSLIPSGLAPGWTVIVRGYSASEHVYRMDRIYEGFSSHGAPGAPITFQAEGWTRPGGKGYVKPIVDGSLAAPLVDCPIRSCTWTSEGSGAFSTYWPDKPAGWLARGAFGDAASAIFQDKTKYLWNRTSVSGLQKRARDGGYFWDAGAKRLYVAPLGGKVSGHTFEVVMDNTFFFKGEKGVSHVRVAGFQVQHSDAGIGFVNGMDYGEAYDNLTMANLYMGIHTSGRMNGSTPDPSVGHILKYNVGRYNTVQAIKISFGTQDTLVRRNLAENNALQGIKVQGTPPNGTYTGLTTNITVEFNTLRNQTYHNPDRGPSDNATGLTLANGAQHVVIDNNNIYRNGIGIHVAQEGQGPRTAPFVDIDITYNRIHDNRRFGINLFDGRYSAAAGSGDVLGTHNRYWNNYIGLMVDQRTSNKRFENETFYKNKLNGITVNGRGVGTSVTVVQSLSTNNGAYGALVSKKGTLYMRWTGLAANPKGPTRAENGGKLTPTTKHYRNAKPADYLSTSPSAANFLKIGPSSYQYKAGPKKTPIGALY